MNVCLKMNCIEVKKYKFLYFKGRLGSAEGTTLSRNLRVEEQSH